MNCSKLSTSLLPNLCTSEQRSRGLACANWLMRSRPLLVRFIAWPASVKTFSICLSSSSRSLFVFLPPQVILLLRAEGAILQSFGIIARENELNGAEKGRVEFRLLVGNILADAVTDRDAAVLQFQHPDGDAVHIHHISGRRSRLPKSVTSSARAKSFFSGSAQLMRWTVSVTLPA